MNKVFVSHAEVQGTEVQGAVELAPLNLLSWLAAALTSSLL
ncbi:MAG: hypothetical protein RMY36_032655 [Nostoc sp. SerVER01]|nr:hypothetical protein [Nostoc sp. SerVER01]MDZ8028621.1 hypothetical protein [Nostoc sp. DedQUE11]